MKIQNNIETKNKTFASKIHYRIFSVLRKIYLGSRSYCERKKIKKNGEEIKNWH